MSGDEVDDPWPKKGSKGRQAELPEAFPTLLLDEELPVSPRDLWRLVMADAQFFRRVQHAMKSSELRLGRWQLGEGAPVAYLLLVGLGEYSYCAFDACEPAVWHC